MFETAYRQTKRNMATIGSVAEFKPKDDFVIYEEKFDQYCKANKVQEDMRVPILISCIGTETYKMLRDLCFPTVPKDKTYADLCALLKQQYSPQVNMFRERIIFYRAVQTADESSAEWFARLKRLASNCSFGTKLESIMADRFISGMKAGSVLDRLVEEDISKSADALLKIAMAKEVVIHNSHNGGSVLEVTSQHGGACSRRHVTGNPHAQKGQQAAQRTSATAHKHQQRHQPTNTGRVNGTTTNRNGGGTADRCKHCSKSHYGVCRFKNYKCDAYGAKGHIKIACKRTENQDQHVNVIDDDFHIFNITENEVNHSKDPIHITLCIVDK